MICIAASTGILKRFILILPILPRKLKTELTFDNIYLYCIRASTACEKYIQRNGGREGGRKGGRAAGREGGRQEEGKNRKREGERECVSEHEFGGEHRKSVYTLHMCMYI